MIIIEHCIAIAAARQLAAYVGLMRIPAPVTGQIVGVALVSRGAVNSNGDTTFDVKKNGVSIFADPADRPKILSGASNGSVVIASEDTVGVTEMVDEITLDLITVPAGGVGGPLWMKIMVAWDNGVSGGSGGEATSIGGEDIYVPPAGYFGDDFNDNIIDPTKWAIWPSVAGITVAEQNNRLELIAASGQTGTTAALKTVALNFTGRTFQAQLVQSGHGTGLTVVFALFTSQGDYWDFEISPGGIMSFNRRLGGTQTPIGSNVDPYDPLVHIYFRFRHDNTAKIIYLETSADNAAWTTRGSVSTSDQSLVDGFVRLQVTTLGTTSVRSTYWDNVLSTIPAPGTIADRSTLMFSQANSRFELTPMPWGVVSDYITGLKLEWLSATGVRIGSGSAYVPGLNKILSLVPVDKTGLTPTANTWYHFYLYQGTDEQPDVEISTTAPAAAYLGTARTKTGDTTRRYIGSLRSADGPGFISFLHTLPQNWILYRTQSYLHGLRIVSSGSATSETTVNCGAVVPVTSRAGYFRFICNAQTLVTGVPDDDDLAGGGGAFGMLNLSAGREAFMLHPLNASQQFSYWHTAAGADTHIDTFGFQFER